MGKLKALSDVVKKARKPVTTAVESLKTAKIAGTALAAGALAPEEAEASFIGTLAKTFPHDMLGMARKMKDYGLSRAEIWQKTGIDLDNVDGLVRSELPDNTAMLNADNLPLREDYGKQYRSGKLPEGFTNEHLSAAYPELDNTDLVVYPWHNSDGTAGNYRNMRVSWAPDMNSSVTLWDNGNTTSIASHEVMHNIQDIEGFAPGGSRESMLPSELVNPGYARIKPQVDEIKALTSSPEYNKELAASNRRFKEVYEPLIDDLDSQIDRRSLKNPQEAQEREALQQQIDSLFDKIRAENATLYPTMAKADRLNAELGAVRKLPEISPYEGYRRLAGEAEARNVQTRLNMTAAERRATPPWETLDVPESEQIVRMKGSATPAALAATAIGTGAGMAAAQQHDSLWDAIMNGTGYVVSQGLEALDMPMKGIYGLSATAGDLLAGESWESAIRRGARVARQPIDTTAREMSDTVYDLTGSPLLGAGVYTAGAVASPL